MHVPAALECPYVAFAYACFAFVYLGLDLRPQRYLTAPHNASLSPTLRDTLVHISFYSSCTRVGARFLYQTLAVETMDLDMNVTRKRKAIRDDDDALMTPKKARLGSVFPPRALRRIFAEFCWYCLVVP